MKSTVVKHSVAIGERRTSVSLEGEFWVCLKEIADSRQMTLTNLIREVDFERRNANLSSALRVFVLRQYREPSAGTLGRMSGSGT
jgi:predicted DNA-binding ribbon-helix-helix protein